MKDDWDRISSEIRNLITRVWNESSLKWINGFQICVCKYKGPKVVCDHSSGITLVRLVENLCLDVILQGECGFRPE